MIDFLLTFYILLEVLTMCIKVVQQKLVVIFYLLFLLLFILNKPICFSLTTWDIRGYQIQIDMLLIPVFTKGKSCVMSHQILRKLNQCVWKLTFYTNYIHSFKIHLAKILMKFLACSQKLWL